MCSPVVSSCYYDLGCIIIVSVILLNVHINTHYYCQCLCHYYVSFFINVCVIILVYYRHVNALRCFYFHCLSFANSFAYWNLQKVES